MEIPGSSMDIYKRAFSVVAAIGPDDVATVDVSDFVRQLLLYDTVVLSSRRFREVPAFVNAFGVRGLNTLLHSSAVELTCEAYCMAEASKVIPNTVPSMERFAFRLARVTQDSLVENSLKTLEKKVGFKGSRFDDLATVLLSRHRRLSKEFSGTVTDQLNDDLRTRAKLVEVAIRAQAKAKHGADLPEEFWVRIEEIGPALFRITSNAGGYGFEPPAERAMILSGVFALGEVSIVLAQSKEYTAMSGTTECNRFLLEQKLSGLAGLISRGHQERRFERVLRAVEFPEFAIQYGERRVDVDRLLKVRESAECIEFRHWLASTDSLTADQIRKLMESVSAKLGIALRSGKGKAFRYLVGLGMGPVHPIASGFVAALDSFAIDRFLPHCGPIAFINDLYPSLFREPDRVPQLPQE